MATANRLRVLRMRAVVLLAAHVVFSSVLGLLPAVLLLEDLGPLDVWALDPLADVVFVTGTVVADVGVFRFVARRPGGAFLPAAALALGGHAIVYSLSIALILDDLALGPGDSAGAATSAYQALVGTLQFGYLGLAFNAAAVPVAARRLVGQTARRQ